MPRKLYIAHPISGLSYEEVMSYYHKVISNLQDYYEIFHPMLGKEYLRTEIKFKAEGYDNPVSTNHAIVERDHWMVSMVDIVYVDFTDIENVSIGCVMELAWAMHMGKHTVVVMDKENIHRHAFIIECADIIFEAENHAMWYLRSIAV